MIGRAVLVMFGIGMIGWFAWLVMKGDRLVGKLLGSVWQLVEFVLDVANGRELLTLNQFLCEFVLIAPLVMLVSYQIWHWIFHSRQGKRRQTYLGQLDNDPIGTECADELNRGDFVQQVVSVLTGRYFGAHALFLGIYGVWGEGKTSVMNLVERQMSDNHRIVFVRFQSWEHEAKEDLPYVLFMQIARRLADRLDLWTGWLLMRYAVLIVPRRLISIAGPFEWVFDIVVRFVNVFSSVPSLAEKIARRLTAIDAKIVVVVDDVDRLEKDDVRTLLRVLRTVGDIGRFVYCILANRDYLASCIQEFKPEWDPDGDEFGRHYLRKIINLELELPRVPKASLASIFVEKLNRILKEYQLEAFSAESGSLSYFEAYVQTYRDVLRLVNELIVRLGYFKTKTIHDFVVHLDDLVAVSIIHLFDPVFWQALYDHHDLFEKTDDCSWISKCQIDADKVDAAFGLNEEDNPHKELRQRFLKEYLGLDLGNDDHGNPVYHYDVDQRKAELDRRLSALACFYMYYSGAVPTLVEASVLRGVQDRLSDESALFAFLKEQNSRHILLRVLEYLEIMEAISDKTLLMNYIRVLVRLADERLAPERGIGRDTWGLEASYGFSTRLMRCALFMLEKVYDKRTDGGAAFLAAVRATESVVLLAVTIRMDDRKSDHRPSRGFLFTDGDYETAKQIFVERIERLQKAGLLIDHAEEEELRRTWHVLFVQERMGTETEAYHKRYVSLVESDAKQYPQVLHVLLPYRYYGDRPTHDYSPMWCQALAEDFGIDLIIHTFEMQNDLPDFATRILGNLKNCKKWHDENGEWLHPDRQNGSSF